MGLAVSTTIGISDITVNTTVSDGGTDYVALKNDKSGNCNGDTGSVDIQYDTPTVFTYPILCAHYTGANRGMAFDYFDDHLVPNTYVVVYIVDVPLGADKAYVGTTTNATLAMKWVNLGWGGSGAQGGGSTFPFADPAGDYCIQSLAPCSF
jgi:hypothetical protein